MDNKMLFNFYKLNNKEREFISWFKNLEEEEKLKNVKTISDTYGVGMSFIYNLLKKINASSFKEFVMFCEEETSLINKELNVLYANKSNSLYTKTFDFYLKSNLANYKLLINQEETINNVVNIIKKAKNVKGIGFGHSYIALQEFGAFFKNINSKFKIYNSNYFTISEEGEKVFIIFSMRSKNINLTNAIKKIRTAKGATKIILFTSNINSKAAKECDYVIEIFNVMNYLDLISEPCYLSPYISWVFVVTILNTIVFKGEKELILKNDDAKKEIDSWEKGSYFM